MKIISKLCSFCFQIFQKLIYADKREVQGEGPFLDGVNVSIRRNYIYEDAYDKLSPENGKQGKPIPSDMLKTLLIKSILAQQMWLS